MSIEQGTFSPSILDKEKFVDSFPSAKINDISDQDLPEVARVFFDKRIDFRVNHHISGNYDASFLIDHNNGDKTFVVQKKVNNSNGSSMDWTYLFDMSQDDHYQGYGELVHSKEGKPFTGYTYSEMRKKGFGKRRLEMMNALSEGFYKEPLHSGVTIEEPARRIWKNLIGEGIAESYMEGESERYKFI